MDQTLKVMIRVEEGAPCTWVVVLIGDALSFLTGNYYRATLHTVVPPLHAFFANCKLKCHIEVNERPQRRLSTVYLLRPAHDRALDSLKYGKLSAQQLFERLTSVN